MEVEAANVVVAMIPRWHESSAKQQRARLPTGKALTIVCATLWSLGPVVVGQMSDEVTIGDENWLASQDRQCEGVWTDSRVGVYDSAAECKLECDLQTETQDQPCHAFAYCRDCFFTDCWICMHEPGPSSWRVVEAEGVVLYQPRSVCPAGAYTAQHAVSTRVQYLLS